MSDSRTISGTYTPAGQSAAVNARVSLTVSSINIVDTDTNERVASCARSETRISSRLGNSARYIRLPDGAQFETDDNDGVDELFADQAGNSLLHRIESNMLLVLVAATSTITFLAWIVLFAIPEAADRIAMSLPDDVVDEIGASSLDLLDRTMFSASELEPDTQHALAAEFAPLVARVDGAALYFRSGPPNAFALPDASIIITDGLVGVLSVDEMRAVVYHELGHIEHRHLLRRSLQGSAIAIVLFLVTGDISNFELLVTVPALLVDLSYSRDFEIEADEYALQTMIAAGEDTDNFRRAMQKLADWYKDGAPDSILPYLSSHPTTDERIALIRQYVK